MAPTAVGGGDGVDEDIAALGAEGSSKAPAGVVLPPKDIRAILEKTAGYVARNGAVFEDRIREKEKHNPKFSFLSANDAYSPFYLWRLGEIREGRGTAVSAGRVGEAAVVEPEEPQGPAEPPEFQFSARMPNISAQDLDVLRLTALFVAKNGRSFVTTLSQREARNFQFDFLRPNHSLYQFFSRLVDQYAELLRAGASDGGNRAEEQRIQELQHNVEDKYHVLERAKQRSEWAKFQEQQKQQKEEEQEKEKVAYAQVDWHDFVVVEEVLFTEDDDAQELPPPTSLNDLQSASLEQRAMMSLHPHNMRIEEAMPEEETYYNPHAPQPVLAPAPPGYNTSEDDESLAIRERTDARERAQQAQAEAKSGANAPMKIRSDYVPRAAAAAASSRRGVQMALCPNCNQQIPFPELDEHMRIELLDPRWKEQRLKADSRYSSSNLSTADVANNLKRLASQRSDVFDGVTGQMIDEEEAKRRKRAENSGYDGMQKEGAKHKGMGVQGGGTLEEQIRNIHQKFGNK